MLHNLIVILAAKIQSEQILGAWFLFPFFHISCCT